MKLENFIRTMSEASYNLLMTGTFVLINGSPIENDALAFEHIYKLNKDEKSITRVKRILTQYSEE